MQIRRQSINLVRTVTHFYFDAHFLFFKNVLDKKIDTYFMSI